MTEIKIEPIIGLEVHVELKTKSKMFCGCDADYFGQEPNTHCCPVCLGLPGALPVPNRKAVEWCILLGLTLKCKVNEESYFERKNYFYPDLPKGYQISQYNKPLTYGGYLDININKQISNKQIERSEIPQSGISKLKKIRINRVHMEEDTGKLTHAVIEEDKATLIDFNRSGVPLVEIVTEPDFNNTEEVIVYLKKLQQIIKYLGVSDADMDKGTMRLEPTINLKIIKDSKIFYTPLVEIKNINSFRFVKQALEYEIERQFTEFEKTGIEKSTGNKTTVGYDEDKKITVLQRSKEEANDYRYFPEPDIPPMCWTKLQINGFKSQIPELPDSKINRFITTYGLSEYDAAILTDEKETADYFDGCIKVLKYQSIKGITIKNIANWIINKKADISKISPEELVNMIDAQNQTPNISDEELEKIIIKVISQSPKAVADYKSGKEQAIMFIMGQVIKETKGASDSSKIIGKIKKLLTLN